MIVIDEYMGKLENLCNVKGTFYHTILSRIWNEDLKVVFFGRSLAAFWVFGDCALIFQQFMRTLQGQ
jgi:hypothetical protein